MHITSEQYDMVLSKMEKNNWPGHTIRAVADRMAPLLIGRKTLTYPLLGPPDQLEASSSPVLALVESEVRKLRMQMGALKLKQWRLKRQMLKTTISLWAKVQVVRIAQGMLPAFNRLNNLENVVVRKLDPDKLKDLEPTQEPIPIPGAPVVISSYENGKGYESWERPVRVKPKREKVPLTEYEKTGSEKQLKVSPQSVDYIIS